jgi:hypothetical protein
LRIGSCDRLRELPQGSTNKLEEVKDAG